MRSALLLIGLLASPVSFAGEKQLTCLFFDDRGEIRGLLDKGAWKSNKIIFNTDDFDQLDPLLTLIGEIKYRYQGVVVDPKWTEEDLIYRVSPSSLIFEVLSEDDPEPFKYRINRSDLTITAGRTKGECSIGDVEVLRDRAF